MTDLIDRETGEILAPPEDNVLVAFALYQQAATKAAWTVHRFINAAQRKSIGARLEEGGGLSAWREALDIASKSDFLCGKIAGNGKPRFKMDLNFMVRPASYGKILDGFYSREPEPVKIHTISAGKPRYAEVSSPFVHDLETPEQRMAFTIERLRAAGQYARANDWEEKLAKLQKRPAILVPSPDVAREGMEAKPAHTGRNPAPAVDLEWTEVPE